MEDVCVTWTVCLEADRARGACATGAFSPGGRHPDLSAHASPPRARVRHGRGLPPRAALVRLIRHVGGVPAAPLGTRLHPDPAVRPAVWPLHLVAWPGLMRGCGGRVLLCIGHRLGTHSMSDLLLPKKASFMSRFQVPLKNTPFYDRNHQQNPHHHQQFVRMLFERTERERALLIYNVK